jgi:hypothetical protein
MFPIDSGRCPFRTGSSGLLSSPDTWPSREPKTLKEDVSRLTRKQDLYRSELMQSRDPIAELP